MESKEVNLEYNLIPSVHELQSLRIKCRMLEIAVTGLKTIVEEQANDAGLWFYTETVSEAYLQSALRKLATAIEEIPI